MCQSRYWDLSVVLSCVDTERQLHADELCPALRSVLLVPGRFVMQLLPALRSVLLVPGRFAMQLLPAGCSQPREKVTSSGAEGDDTISSPAASVKNNHPRRNITVHIATFTWSRHHTAAAAAPAQTLPCVLGDERDFKLQQTFHVLERQHLLEHADKFNKKPVEDEARLKELEMKTTEEPTAFLKVSQNFGTINQTKSSGGSSRSRTGKKASEQEPPLAHTRAKGGTLAFVKLRPSLPTEEKTTAPEAGGQKDGRPTV
ncbi:unnamed protein product [Pleuronectes platessa]|uniref:Uncharacterized protein n=1 Tax=Pleuronectes platessa TaxID=8262 RepID=A0A9N7Z8U8_PLEPL|nr:unnamed protein product [Pleuronectes platessa]